MQIVVDLIQEHRVITSVLGVLDRVARRLADDRRWAPPEELSDIVGFLREYVDGIHHQKEEGILFETIDHERSATGKGRGPEGSGNDADVLPTACLRHDHKLGRMMVGWMGELVERRTGWNRYEREWFAERAIAYVGLLQGHIEKEDRLFFPQVEGRLGAEGRRRVEERYVPSLGQTAALKWVELAARLQRLP